MLTEVRAAGPKGLGLFARLAIPRGTRILSERPLLALKHDEPQPLILSQAQTLPGSSKSKLLALSMYPGAGVEAQGRFASSVIWTLRDVLARKYSLGKGLGVFSENRRILDIWRSNSFRLNSREYDQALFPSIARINHECSPNSQANFSEEMASFNVHATRDIVENEEISLSYLPVDGLMLRDERVGKLKDGYGFECGCPACQSGSALGEKVEEGRRRMRERLAEFAGMESGEKERRAMEIAVTRELVEMLEGEGHGGMEVANMWGAIARMEGELGREEEARRAKERETKIRRLCLG